MVVEFVLVFCCTQNGHGACAACSVAEFQVALKKLQSYPTAGYGWFKRAQRELEA